MTGSLINNVKHIDEDVAVKERSQTDRHRESDRKGIKVESIWR